MKLEIIYTNRGVILSANADGSSHKFPIPVPTTINPEDIAYSLYDSLIYMFGRAKLGENVAADITRDITISYTPGKGSKGVMNIDLFNISTEIATKAPSDLIPDLSSEWTEDIMEEIEDEYM